MRYLTFGDGLMIGIGLEFVVKSWLGKDEYLALTAATWQEFPLWLLGSLFGIFFVTSVYFGFVQWKRDRQLQKYLTPRKVADLRRRAWAACGAVTEQIEDPAKEGTPQSDARHAVIAEYYREASPPLVIAMTEALDHWRPSGKAGVS